MTARVVRRGISLAVPLAAVAVAATAGHASFPGANGRIFLVGSELGAGAPTHVYSVAPDGTRFAQETSGPESDLAVAPSPDGARLVVERDTGDQCGHLFWRAGYDLYTTALGSSSLTRLTHDCPVDEVSPAWSPSGDHLVFSSGGSIWVARADGTLRTRLTCTGGDDDFFPAWSPDGRRIAYDHDGEIEIMDLEGSLLTRVATGWTPSFSPDGRRIAYSGADASPGIHVVNVDGSADVRVTTAQDGSPSWSPDGTQIAFVRYQDGGPGALHTIRSDGTGSTTLVDQVNVASAAWSNAVGSTTAAEPNVTPEQTACPETASPPPTTPTLPADTPPIAGVGQGWVDASTLQPPNRLVVVRVSFRPRILRSYKPFTVSLTIDDRAGHAVRGAVVQVTPTTGAIRTTAQLRTDLRGSIVARLVPTRNLKLRAGRRVVLAVRVRRPGDPWGSETSGLRLISVRTAPAR